MIPSWKISDDAWHSIAPLLEPIENKDASNPTKQNNKTYRMMFEAMAYALHTNCQWAALPLEQFGQASQIEIKFYEWLNAGVFDKLNNTKKPEIETIAAKALRQKRNTQGRH